MPAVINSPIALKPKNSRYSRRSPERARCRNVQCRFMKYDEVAETTVEATWALIGPMNSSAFQTAKSSTVLTTPMMPNFVSSLIRACHRSRSRRPKPTDRESAPLSPRGRGDRGPGHRRWPDSLMTMHPRTGLPVVGMVGAGQLARMTHQAAIALGQSLRILAVSPDDGAALVAADVLIGDYRDLDDLRAFARGCDVVTFDHEHVPNEHLVALEADGVAVQPSAAALRFAQDKQAMRE